MKWNRPITLVIILEIAILFLLTAGNAEKTKTSTILSQLSSEESKIVIEKMATFGQILELYATMALEKPPDLRSCAYEMFQLKRNEKSCRDKHSMWHSKEQYQEFILPDTEGKFGGVGLQITDDKEGKIIIISTIDDAPAHRAGLKAEDEIIKVDNKKVKDSEDATKRLRGEAGTSVEITVKRDNREILFKIIREIITVHAVSAKIINSPSGVIGYIKVQNFSKIMPKELHKEIMGFRNKGINKIILDFRNNPGGLLDSALNILYDFARPDDILMVMRTQAQSIVFDTVFVKKDLTLNREPGMFRDMSAVVLINKSSASASEIFAGAMKDWGFPVVGSCSSDNRCSFGKGVGQTLFPLVDGSAFRLTTFEFLVGNSKTKINDIGVIPTYKVLDPMLSAAEVLREDKPLEKAIEILSH